MSGMGTLGWLLILMALAGCTSYYSVQDPTGGRTYFTDHVSELDSGAVRFKDLQTGATITLQASAVKKLSKGDLPPGLVK
jgi:hypothetical protein